VLLENYFFYFFNFFRAPLILTPSVEMPVENFVKHGDYSRDGIYHPMAPNIIRLHPQDEGRSLFSALLDAHCKPCSVGGS